MSILDAPVFSTRLWIELDLSMNQPVSLSHGAEWAFDFCGYLGSEGH